MRSQAGGIPSVNEYGARPDGQGDNLQAFQQAIHALAVDKNRGGRLFIPPGRYRFSAPLHISRGMVLEGASGAGRNAGTVLTFDSGLDGIIIDRASTSDDGGAGDWTVIRDLAVQAVARGSSGNGLTLHARARIENVYVRGFGGNGIEIAATARGNGANSNANNWNLENIFIEQNGGHGLHVIGADANAGIAVAVSAMGNDGWGFLDESFLGNTYIGCHSEGNKKGGYSVTNPNARSVFVGSYTENGQPPNVINSPSMVVGGFFGPQGTGYFLADGTISPNWTARNQKDAKLTTTLGFGGEVPRGVLSFTAADGSLPYRVEYQKSGTGWWNLNYGQLDNGTVLSFSTSKAEEGASQLRFPNGFSIGQGKNARKFSPAALQPPSMGVHQMGEIVFSADPGRNGFVGWIAVKSGSPGDWVPFGGLLRAHEVQAARHASPAEGRVLPIAFSGRAEAVPIAFDAAISRLQKITLREDVIGSDIKNLSEGTHIDFVVCQDRIGGHSFRWPQNIRGGMKISVKRGNCSAQSFVSDGSLAFAVTPGAVSASLGANQN